MRSPIGRVLIVGAVFVSIITPANAQPKPDAKKPVQEKQRELTPEEKERAAAAGTTILGMSLVLGITVLVGGLMCYFAPTLIALMRGHANVGPIIIVNAFLGWSLIGWVVALAWAFSNQERPRYRRGY